MDLAHDAVRSGLEEEVEVDEEEEGEELVQVFDSRSNHSEEEGEEGEDSSPPVSECCEETWKMLRSGETDTGERRFEPRGGTYV